MYSYIHDPETGGILLNSSPTEFSKEARPVYAGELDLLGFDKYWQYDSRLDVPYMWAESNFYWYRGRRVARITGGNIYSKPAIVLENDSEGQPLLTLGEILSPIDISAMIEKNKSLLDIIDNITKKRIYYYFSRYKDKFDFFRLSFSGGKDSTVLLHLLKDTIPSDKLVILFCDTRMELPDTYNFIDQISLYCKDRGLKFYIASSSRDAIENWKIFGPPSRILRWCCSVHKSAPMTLKMREIGGKTDFSELVFVGVRSHESDARANYKYLDRSKKVNGQTTCNAILDWTSAEVWLYTYYKQLPINDAYKYGNQRVGCIFCPMSPKTDYIKHKLYKDRMKEFIDIVREHFSEEDIVNGYWCARTNGELLCDNQRKVYEEICDEKYVLTIANPVNDLNPWIKTVKYNISDISITFNKNMLTLKVNSDYYNRNRTELSIIKNVLFKVAFCQGCGVCAANCSRGCIEFREKISITDCIKCQSCNKLDYGCLILDSRRYPPIKEKGMAPNVIDRYATHPPKTEWFERLFKDDGSIIDKNRSDLGKEKVPRFRAFLNDTDLLRNKQFSPLFHKLADIDWNGVLAASLMIVNMANSPQFQWYIKNMAIGTVYDRKQCIQMIYDQGYSDRVANNVIGAFRHFCELIFCRLVNWGAYTLKGSHLATLCRTKPTPPDPRVFLYGLYKFAEALDGYHEIPLGRLMDFEKESAAISPSEIFALTREETAQYLRGLAQNFPDFVPNFISTHGLEILYLNPEKSADDVLELFAQGVSHALQ